MNLLSGNIKARNKKYPIVWTGQNAQHLAERHVDENSLHPFLHMEVQQMAQTAVWKKEGNTRTYYAKVEVNKGKFWIIGILHSHFFEIKTCYKHG
jgi:hypothetical protein